MTVQELKNSNYLSVKVNVELCTTSASGRSRVLQNFGFALLVLLYVHLASLFYAGPQSTFNLSELYLAVFTARAAP
jgi:hypothetical protein